MKVSVIVPTYNCSKYIEQTLRSVLLQTLQNFEIIVVDDCSTDDTVNIVKSINDQRIKLFINGKNMGAAYSRNVALRHSNGEYIAFLDGDDMWFSNKLEKQISFMEKTGCQFSYTNYDEIDGKGQKLRVFLTGPKKVTHKQFMEACYVGCLTVVYKRDLFPDLQIPADIYKRNDYAMWLKISERADCVLLDEVLASYRKGVGISSMRKVKLLKYHEELFIKLYEYRKFQAWLLALRNALFYVLKRVKYRRKIKTQ